MQRLITITAKSIWLFPIADLNPEGKAIESDLVKWLAGKYYFQKFPASTLDVNPENKTLEFSGGKFKSNGDYLAVDLSIYNDGIVANTRSSTEDTDRFVREALENCVNEFGLNYPRIRKRIYLSEMDVKLDKPMKLLNP